ncbi:probable methyltransferase-like protein 25 [Periplaneta americana]|uniref:probable methyltransferase-like protein 25 n=1 Tax=Periplaneta americana TaxID=6978 RepID=UPI0037E9A9DE
MQAEITAKLEEITRYLKPFLPLANCHMVNFITQDVWKTHVPDAIRREIASVKVEILDQIFVDHASGVPVNELNGELGSSCPNFIHFLNSARNACLRGSPGRRVIITRSEFQKKLAEWAYHDNQESLHVEQFMTRKKMHEVEVMSQMVAALADVSGASYVVDVGGGKGYLSSILALHHGLRVLGVDSSQVNTHGAAKRSKKLEKQWSGLCRRADILKQGNIPPKRGKHWKSRSNLESSDDCKCETTEDDGETASKNQTTNGTLYKQVTAFVTQLTDLRNLVKEQFECEDCENLALAGLHTCGDLAATCLRIFVNREEFSSLCNVGCCYHLLEEEYVRSPFWTDVEPPLPAGVQFGFPMSEFLNRQEFSLGRNARMLSAQALDRIGENHQLTSEPLFFRALLQVLLIRKCGEHIPWGQVGRLKYQNFVDYVQKAVQKLHLSIEVSEDEIEALHRNYLNEQQQLHVFFLLRLSLAPVIETVILLDRLLYLHEKGIQESYLVQLFDPVISPRCYCIISLKNPPEKTVIEKEENVPC